MKYYYITAGLTIKEAHESIYFYQFAQGIFERCLIPAKCLGSHFERMPEYKHESAAKGKSVYISTWEMRLRII